MFDNIEQLERQVKEFQENILASSALVKSIEELTVAVRKQQEEQSETARKLLDDMEQKRVSFQEQAAKILSDIEEQTRTIPNSVAKENAATVEQIRQAIADYDRLLHTSLEQIKSNNEAIAEKTLKTHTELNKSYIEQLEKTSSVINDMIEQLELRYNQFLERLESTNIDQLFAEVQKMKKSLETKMTLVLTGVGIAVVIAVISLFIR